MVSVKQPDEDRRNNPWMTLHCKTRLLWHLSCFSPFPFLSSPLSQLEIIQSWPTGPLPLTDSNYDCVRDVFYCPHWWIVSLKGKDGNVVSCLVHTWGFSNFSQSQKICKITETMTNLIDLKYFDCKMARSRCSSTSVMSVWWLKVSIMFLIFTLRNRGNSEQVRNVSVIFVDSSYSRIIWADILLQPGAGWECPVIVRRCK